MRRRVLELELGLAFAAGRRGEGAGTRGHAAEEEEAEADAAGCWATLRQTGRRNLTASNLPRCPRAARASSHSGSGRRLAAEAAGVSSHCVWALLVLAGGRDGRGARGRVCVLGVGVSGMGINASLLRSPVGRSGDEVKQVEAVISPMRRSAYWGRGCAGSRGWWGVWRSGMLFALRVSIAMSLWSNESVYDLYKRIDQITRSITP